jgi:DNA-binding GntR family transcriptional regulator
MEALRCISHAEPQNDSIEEWRLRQRNPCRAKVIPYLKDDFVLPSVESITFKQGAVAATICIRLRHAHSLSLVIVDALQRDGNTGGRAPVRSVQHMCRKFSQAGTPIGSTGHDVQAGFFCQQIYIDFVHTLRQALFHLASFPPTVPNLISERVMTATSSESGISRASHEVVFAQIHEAILENRLPPGSKLKEVPLAQHFSVTRGTIRKALAQLAAMKVVELRPNRGAIVASPGIERSHQIFAARRAIEGALAESLAANPTLAQVRKLKSLIRLENAAYRDGDMRHALKRSIDFHRQLASMAGNAVMAEMLEQLISQTPLVLLAWRDPNQSGNCANTDHAELVAAIEARNPKKASEAMKCHLCNLEGQLRRRKAEPADELTEIFGRNPATQIGSQTH